jgi:large subunit ribosomal protein L9
MTSEKLILLDDVENLGLAGDEVNVASGYARNFLLPKKLAMKASPGALRVFAARKEKIEAQRKDELAKAKSLAEKIASAEVSIAMEASDDEQLYGSVTERIIADKLAEQGIEVDHHKIKLEEHIKQLGMFNVEIKLHQDLSATLKVWIVRS